MEDSEVRSTGWRSVLDALEEGGSWMEEGLRERATMRWLGCEDRIAVMRERPMPEDVPVTVGFC